MSGFKKRTQGTENQIGKPFPTGQKPESTYTPPKMKIYHQVRSIDFKKQDVIRVRDKFFRGLKIYSEYIESRGFQYATGKNRVKADKKGEEYEKWVRWLLKEWKEKHNEVLKFSFMEQAMINATDSAMSMGSHDMWRDRVKEYIDEAKKKPSRYVHDIEIYDVFKDEDGWRR